MHLTRCTLSAAALVRLCALAAAGSSAPLDAQTSDTARAGVVVDPRRHEVLLRLDPVDLPAAPAVGGHDEHGGMAQPRPLTVALPVDGWLTSYRVDVEDAAGRPLPRALVHHVNLIVPTKRELFSPIMLRLAASGAETAPVRLPGPLGYRASTADSLIVTAMLHNPTGAPVRAARVVVRLGYAAGGLPVPRMSVYPLYLDVMPPAGKHAYDLPPGRSSRSWEGRPAVSGRILGLGGHLHKYGVALRLEDASEGRVLWETRPVLDPSGEVIAMPTAMFLWRLGLRVHASHVYRLVAEYDNPTGCVIPDGAMGALGGVFRPDRGARWPSIDPDDEAARTDRQSVLDTSGMSTMADMHDMHDMHAVHDLPEPGTSRGSGTGGGCRHAPAATSGR